jgi:hypothetical protein
MSQRPVSTVVAPDQWGWREGRDADRTSTPSYLLANPTSQRLISILWPTRNTDKRRPCAAYTTPGAFAFNFSDAHVSFADGHDLLEAPDGTITDVTGIAKLTFADGVIQESDGQPLWTIYSTCPQPDVWAAHVDPDLYYAQNWHEGRDPVAFPRRMAILPTTRWQAHINPFVHYDQNGWKKDAIRDCFDTSSYLAANPDAAAAHIDPLLHYLQFGMAEGRPRLDCGIIIEVIWHVWHRRRRWASCRRHNANGRGQQGRYRVRAGIATLV